MAERLSDQTHSPGSPDNLQAQADLFQQGSVVYGAEMPDKSASPGPNQAHKPPSASEQTGIQWPDINNAFLTASSSVSGLRTDPGFLKACRIHEARMRQGANCHKTIEWLHDAHTALYWQVVANFMHQKAAMLHRRGAPALYTDTLRLLAATPAFLFALQPSEYPVQSGENGEDVVTILPYEERLAAVATTAPSTELDDIAGNPDYFMQLIRTFVATYPGISAEQLHTALLNSVLTAFDSRVRRDIASDDLRYTIYHTLDIPLPASPEAVPDAVSPGLPPDFEYTADSGGVTRQEIVHAFASILSSIGDLVVDRRFQHERDQQGFRVTSDIENDLAYWHFFADYMRNRLGNIQGRGGSPLYAGTLALLSAAPSLLVAHRESNSAGVGIERKRVERTFSELIFDVAEVSPATRASDVTRALFSITRTAFTREAISLYAARMLPGFVRAQQHKIAAGTIFSVIAEMGIAPGFNYERASPDEDGLHADYVLYPAPGKLICVEVRADSDRTPEAPRFQGGRIIIGSTLSAHELQDRFVLPKAIAQTKAPAMLDIITQAGQYVA